MIEPDSCIIWSPASMSETRIIHDSSLTCRRLQKRLRLFFIRKEDKAKKNHAPWEKDYILNPLGSRGLFNEYLEMCMWKERGFIWSLTSITANNGFIIFIHYNDVIMGAIASQITSPMIVFSTVYLETDQRKHQSSASLAFVRGIHRRPVNSPHKWPVTRKMFPFDDVIILDWFS